MEKTNSISVQEQIQVKQFFVASVEVKLLMQMKVS